MNCNLSCRNCLSDVCDVFGLTNLVKHPTCFKGDIPTLLDACLTNRPNSFIDVLNLDIGTFIIMFVSRQEHLLRARYVSK